jgi:hypothetical protein
MAATIVFTDPTTHPKFVREQRQITAILVRLIMRRGRSERQAIQEAEALLVPLPRPKGSAKRQQLALRAR